MGSYRFIFNGVRRRGDQSPGDIGIEDGDQIEVMLDQQGDIGGWGDHAEAVGTPLLLAGGGGTAEESRAVMAALGAKEDGFESHADARLLDAAECAALRQLVDDARRADEQDFKLDLSRSQLAACVGASALARLVAFVREPFDAIKLRRVEPSGKVINFHMDVCHQCISILGARHRPTHR